MTNKPNNWMTYEFPDEHGDPLDIYIITSVPSEYRYKNHVRIIWKFQKPMKGDIYGDEAKIIKEFEGALNGVEDEDVGNSIMVLIMRDSEKIIWLFYVNDLNTYFNKFDKTMRSFKGYPVNVEYTDDEKWECHEDIIEFIKSKGGPLK